MTELPVGGPCRICGADLRLIVLDLGLRPDLDDFRAATGDDRPELRTPLRMWLCETCGLAQVGRDTPHSRRPHGHGTMFSTTGGAADEEWIRELVSLDLVGPGRRVLDITAGSGRRLRAARAAGAHVAGFESDTMLAAVTDYDPDIHPGRFQEPGARGPAGSFAPFDLILVSHALAHEDDPGQLISAITGQLAPGGAVAIEFHHLLELVRTRQFDIISGAHRSYLSMIALTNLLDRFDLAITSTSGISLHGGVLRVVARRRSDDPRATLDATRLIAEERAMGLQRAEGFVGVAEHATEASLALGQYLRQQRRTGRRVIGYGAPSRGALLLDMARITREDLPFTVDRAPDKQGRLLPGTHVPVLTPERLVAAEPDEVLILAWTLKQEIIGQLRPLLPKGPRYVVAMPRLEVVE